jgi:hypothetical protein
VLYVLVLFAFSHSLQADNDTFKPYVPLKERRKALVS